MLAEGGPGGRCASVPPEIRAISSAYAHFACAFIAVLTAASVLWGPTPAVAAPASAEALGWSDPIQISVSTTAATPAVAAAGDRIHVFWLDRRGPTPSTGDLWHTVLSADGRRLRQAAILRSGVDTRLAAPTAASWNGRTAVAWMSRTAEGVTVEIGILDNDGSIERILRPDPEYREEAGRIALLPSPDGILYVVWSQFDRGRRQIWYVRVRPDEPGHSRPVPLVEGDAPALVVDPQPALFWWEGGGAGGFRLWTGVIDGGHLRDRRALTGAISLVAPLPVLPAVVDGAHVLLIPTLERAFSTSGRLYGMRLGSSETTPARVPLLGRTRVSDVSVASDGRTAYALWSQAVGRRQNSELHGARLVAGAQGFMDTPSRLTYTIPGSLRPAGAVLGGRIAAVWLEVAGLGEFSISFGTSASPRRHRFLLGITELDLFRPWGLLAFGALTAVSILPIALLIAAATLLPAAALLSVARMLAAPFRRMEEVLERPDVRVALLIAAAVAIQIAARGLIPGDPSTLLLVVPPLCVLLLVLTLFGGKLAGPLGRGLVAGALVLLGVMIALFPWGAAQLSQF